MYWYEGWYGSWREPNGVRRVQIGTHGYDTGTYDRKEMFEKAQETANKTGKTVTVSATCGSCNGLTSKYWEVKPE